MSLLNFSLPLLLPLLLLMLIGVSSESTQKSSLPLFKTPPIWQTVFPDTEIAIPLFGSAGPRWQLDDSSNTDLKNLTAQVPGDLVSDLIHNKMLGDPYYDMNLWEQQDIWLGPQRQKATRSQRKYDRKDDNPPKPCQKQQTTVWTYSTEIELAGLKNIRTWQLIIESIQMGATVRWNGVFLANITDQFLRYSLTLEPRHLQAAKPNNKRHNLSITFDPSIDTNGRFMACAGGWDWAPYTLACDAKDRRIFTMGIVQPIYLIGVEQFAITHVVPKVYYQGSSKSRYVNSILGGT